MPSKLLGLGNTKKLVEALRPLIGPEASASIELELKSQTAKLYALGLQHYRFGKGQPARHWRQKVSRLYYAAYAASRATRLFVTGNFSIDVKDHQKIGHLPDDFPRKEQFGNQLDILREDRNTCDYDHACSSTALVIPHSEAQQLVEDFLNETKKYLEGRGLQLRGKP